MPLTEFLYKAAFREYRLYYISTKQVIKGMGDMDGSRILKRECGISNQCCRGDCTPALSFLPPLPRAGTPHCGSSRWAFFKVPESGENTFPPLLLVPHSFSSVLSSTPLPSHCPPYPLYLMPLTARSYWGDFSVATATVMQLLPHSSWGGGEQLCGELGSTRDSCSSGQVLPP